MGTHTDEVRGTHGQVRNGVLAAVRGHVHLCAEVVGEGIVRVPLNAELVHIRRVRSILGIVHGTTVQREGIGGIHNRVVRDRQARCMRQTAGTDEEASVTLRALI